MFLVGAVSLHFYKNIKVDDNDERNILFLGDYHNDLTFGNCCKNNEKVYKRIETMIYSVNFTYKLLYLLDVVTIIEDEIKINSEIDSNYLDGIDKDIEYVLKIDTEHLTVGNILINSKIKQKIIKLKNKLSNRKFENILEITNEIVNYCEHTITETIMMIKNRKNYDNDTDCILLFDFIYKITENNNCFDYYYEVGKANEYISMPSFEYYDYLAITQLLFHSFKYLKYYEKRYDKTIFNNMYTNLRFHESDIRLSQNHNVYESYFSYYLPEIKKIHYKYVNDNNLVSYVKSYIIDFIGNILKNKSNDNDNLYQKIYEQYSEKLQNTIKKEQTDKIYKQYSKSIFYGKNIDKLLSIMLDATQIDLNNKHAWINDIKEFKTEQLHFMVEVTNMNIYTLFRMFIKKDGWNNEKHNVDNKCSNYTYPKNIMCSLGDYHVIWLKYFVDNYFNVKPTISKTAYERNNMRCIEISKKIFNFEV